MVTTVAAIIAESVGSLFGSSKIETLERECTTLYSEIATHGETIEALQTRKQTIQANRSLQLVELQHKHLRK